MNALHLCSFSGAVSELSPAQLRDPGRVLETVARSPRVSTWDMENRRIRSALYVLQARGLVVEVPEPYPWLRFELTDAGRAELGSRADSAPALGASDLPPEPV